MTFLLASFLQTGKENQQATFKPFSFTYVRYRSIITSFLHASPRVMPRVFRVESAKIYRGNLNFHVTGRGFSTRGLVALHDMWHFHERTHGSSTRQIVEVPRDESWHFHETNRGISTRRIVEFPRNESWRLHAKIRETHKKLRCGYTGCSCKCRSATYSKQPVASHSLYSTKFVYD